MASAANTVTSPANTNETPASSKPPAEDSKKRSLEEASQGDYLDFLLPPAKRGALAGGRGRGMMAPRAARMAQLGIKDYAPKAPPKPASAPEVAQQADMLQNQLQEARDKLKQSLQKLRENPAGPSPAQSAMPAIAKSHSLIAEIKDPYDPAKPNDYTQWKEDLMRKKDMELAEKIRRESEEEFSRMAENTTRIPIRPGAEIPPLAPHINEEQQQQPQQMDVDDIDGVPLAPGEVATPPVAPPSAPAKGLSIGEKLLKKMGWKGRGHGLGRNQQGISEPLIAQKAAGSAQGVILNPDALRPDRFQQQMQTSLPPELTTCISLMNMVGPGEVDQNLCAEVGQECSRFGKVLDVFVFESLKSGIPPETAVKLFVKFETREQALKALMDLDGRLFAGRHVVADCFPEDKFAKQTWDS